jgi:hypothetical protein
MLSRHINWSVHISVLYYSIHMFTLLYVITVMKTTQWHYREPYAYSRRETFPFCLTHPEDRTYTSRRIDGTTSMDHVVKLNL